MAGSLVVWTAEGEGRVESSAEKPVAVALETVTAVVVAMESEGLAAGSLASADGAATAVALTAAVALVEAWVMVGGEAG